MLVNRIRYNLDGGAGDGGSGSGGATGEGSQQTATTLLGSGGSSAAADQNTGSSTPEWAAGLPDELKSSPSLGTYKDLPSFVKSALEAEKLIGKKGIIKPGENATAEDKIKFYTELGRPEKADGYQLTKPENWPNDVPFSDAAIPAAQQIFHKNNVPAEMAQGIFNDYSEWSKEQFGSHATVSKQEVEQGLARLEQEWGGKDKFNANIETAKMAVQEFGGSELVDFLESTGLGNHPGLIKAFANAGKSLREDSFSGGGAGSGGALTTERAKAEIERLNNDKEFTKAYYSNKAEDRQAQQEARIKMEKLYEIAYPTFTK